MTILIVDDTKDKVDRIENVINELFTDNSVVILKAENNADAMKILQSKIVIDLMILDLNLPIRTGEEPKKNAGKILLSEIIRRKELIKPGSIIGLTQYEDCKEIFDEKFNKEGWVVAYYSPKLTTWEETIRNKIIYLNNQKLVNNSNCIDLKTDKVVVKKEYLNDDLPIVVILTAIKQEYSAVRLHLIDIIDSDRNDTSYEEGIFCFNNEPIAKIFIRECGARTENASQETERAIQYFKPNVIFFVGIAGSRKPQDFKIGDVIFPEKIYSYEGGKAAKNTFMARPELDSLTFTLTEKAKKERIKDDWKVLIKGNYDYSPKADLGVIASGNIVIEHYNSNIGRILTKFYNDTSAVEMEGFGFAKAAAKQGRETNKVLVGVVRGISDILESENNSSSSIDRRPDLAKVFASDSASAFTFWLIYKLYRNN